MCSGSVSWAVLPHPHYISDRFETRNKIDANIFTLDPVPPGTQPIPWYQLGLLVEQAAHVCTGTDLAHPCLRSRLCPAPNDVEG